MTDILTNLFGELSYDIQEKIFNEVLELKDIENTKRNHKLLMSDLLESMYKSGDYKYELNNVYKYLDIGKRVIGETSNGCMECDTIYDSLYYDNLDFILMCDIDTDINTNNNEITFNYKLKDNYSYLRNYYENWIENNDMDIEELEDYEVGLRYDCRSLCYDLFDFVDIDLEECSYELEEIMYENIDRDNETIKILLYECSNRKIFYGKLEKYNDLMLF